MSKICDFVKLEAEKLAQNYNFYVVDVEYVKKHAGFNLTIYLDKENGITLDDLEMFSKAIEPILDENEAIFSDAYTLNCSSPGLDRNLKTDVDFKLALNKELIVKFYKPLKPYNKKEIIGVLKDYSADAITIKYGEDGALVSIPKQTIASITKNIKF